MQSTVDHTFNPLQPGDAKSLIEQVIAIFQANREASNKASAEGRQLGDVQIENLQFGQEVAYANVVRTLTTLREMLPATGNGDAPTDFRKGLENLINLHSLENGSDTPDFILGDYLRHCLEAFDNAVRTREVWYGRGDAYKVKPTLPESK